MTLKQAAIKAIKTHDVRLFSGIQNQLRGMGFDYRACQQWFQRWGLAPDDFEGLCYEADQLESGDDRS